MIISKLLKICSNIKNKRISSFLYKVCKLYINVLFSLRPPKISNGIDENSNVIISLTTFPTRINTVWLTVITLLNQTVKPKMIILWLAKEQFPNKEALPSKLLDLEKYGLTIKFCEDLKPHKKYYFTLKQYPDADIITVDDDIFYPEDLVELLTETSKKNPDTVCCLWGVEINVHLNEISPYMKWVLHTQKTNPSLSLMPVGCGGVLYPAHIFNGTDLLNKNAIKKLCLNNDDLWLKSMCVLNETKAIRVNKYSKIHFSILSTQKQGLHYENAGKNKNDIAMKNIINEYPEVQKILAHDNRVRKKA
jgi:uncharacterized pyridoxamine 5'-phosphate oxidase family protein